MESFKHYSEALMIFLRVCYYRRIFLYLKGRFFYLNSIRSILYSNSTRTLSMIIQLVNEKFEERGKTRILSKIRGYIGQSAAPRCGNIMRNYAENRSIASCVIARVDLNIHDATKVEKRPLYRGSMLERAAIDNGKCIANSVTRCGM